ncbi:hypothetical protein CS8_063050 [Cupriavidus sp. 8B]
MDLNSSPDKCVELPAPDEAKLSEPGLLLASATSSGTVVTGRLGDTTRMFAFWVT